MDQAAILFPIMTALVLPLVLSLVWARKYGSFRPVLLGALTFIIFQVLTRIPLLQIVLPRFDWYAIFSATRPVLFLLLLSFTAGIFEEIGRYLMMKRFLKESPFSHSIGFGIGHGGVEAILLVGITILVTLIQTGGRIPGVPPLHFVFSGIERLFAMTAHVGLSVMVWRSVRTGRRMLLPLAISLHGLMNFSAVFLLQRGMSLLAAEGMLGLFAAGFLLYILKIHHTTKRGNEDETKVR